MSFTDDAHTITTRTFISERGRGFVLQHRRLEERRQAIAFDVVVEGLDDRERLSVRAVQELAGAIVRLCKQPKLGIRRPR